MTVASTGVEQFDVEYFDRLKVAQGHWWVQGMADIADRLVVEPRSSLRVLDAGCGSGALLEWAAGLGAPRRVTAVDFASSAVAWCRRTPHPVDVVQASVTDLPFAATSFDLIVSMDVLQHLTEDHEARAVREMARVLVPGGRAVVRTNARFGRRRVAGRDDWRLYEPDTLRRALERGGLAVERVTPVNAIQGLWASLPRRRPPTDHHGEHAHDESAVHGLGIPTPVGPLKNAVLRRLLSAEAAWLSSGRHLPFGHSLYAVARNPA